MSIALRRAGVDDAEPIAALAIQVFLDTYASTGIRPDLAHEALATYAPERFVERLREPERSFLLAETEAGLRGFAEFLTTPSRPTATAAEGCELVRLYVQPAAQRSGLGRCLLGAVEQACAGQRLWLTAWAGNTRALAFYRAVGYTDVGAVSYRIAQRDYENRILVKACVTDSSQPPTTGDSR